MPATELAVINFFHLVPPTPPTLLPLSEAPFGSFAQNKILFSLTRKEKVTFSTHMQCSRCAVFSPRIFYMKAIKASDLSITVPMLTFSPLFLLITSPLTLGEFPNLFGLFGILFIVAGSYMLNIKQRKEGWLVPFKALLSQNGPKFMLIVAFLWSISANFDKIGEGLYFYG